MNGRNRYPTGRDYERVQSLIQEYEAQTDEQALAEDEAAFVDQSPDRHAHSR